MINEVQRSDFDTISQVSYIDWKELDNSRILITGSTGLIGSNLTLALLYVAQKHELNIQIVLPVRNVNKAYELFSDYLNRVSIFDYKLGDELHLSDRIDYIVHCASPTSSKCFSQTPVDVLLTNIMGTKAILEYAKSNHTKKTVFLSSMEVYGFPDIGSKVIETDLGAFDTMVERNSYPIAKMACESLCRSYFKQYGVQSVVLRLTQTFGPGIKYDDGRVFAEFIRCAMERKNIILKTKGETERPYLYTADAITAIVLAMVSGQPGEAYTVANPDSYCSISFMAEMVANVIAGKQIAVEYDLTSDVSRYGYAQTLHMNLDIGKIKELGWTPLTSLTEMYRKSIEYLLLEKNI